jgi:alkyl sulfatase BDS1-like metallo-beta-lactamase superfamily hydrolase
MSVKKYVSLHSKVSFRSLPNTGLSLCATKQKKMASHSADLIFEAVREALPLWQSKLKAVVIMNIEDQDWLCDGKKGIVEKLKGAPPSDVELTVTTSLSTFQELIDKRLTAQQAFMKGKLKIKGNMGLAMKLTSVIDATRRYLPPSKL